jgi:AcrR family transcriptional regulator
MTKSKTGKRAQVERTSNLMLDAAAGLLAEAGPSAVTHLRVAQEAGVARATVYRHWPTRASILLALIQRGVALNFSPPGDGVPLQERLAAGLQGLASALNGEVGQTVSAMVGLAEWDEEVFAALEKMTKLGPRMMRAVLEVAIDAGELREGTDFDILVDQLVGPILLRRLMYHQHISSEYVDRLINSVIQPHLA